MTEAITVHVQSVSGDVGESVSTTFGSRDGGGGGFGDIP